MPNGGRARAVAVGAYGRLTSRARAPLSTKSRPAHERPGHQRRRHATPQGLSPRTWVNSAGAAGRAEISQVPPTDRVSCASKAPPGASAAVVPAQRPGQHWRHFSESARAKQSWLLKCCPARPGPARTRLRRPAAVSVAAQCESAGWLAAAPAGHRSRCRCRAQLVCRCRTAPTPGGRSGPAGHCGALLRRAARERKARAIERRFSAVPTPP